MKNLKVRLFGPVQKDSIVDGEGLRTVIWFQGCPHHCPGCHNPESHDFKSGKEVPVDEILEKIDNLRNQDGITFSGGEPMSQPEALLVIAKHIKEKGLNTWCYSGFTFEQLLEMAQENEIYFKILENIDVLVDGRFEIKEKSLDLKFKGSANQRILDVKKSLKEQKPILIPKYKKRKSSSKSKKVNNKVKTLFI